MRLLSLSLLTSTLMTRMSPSSAFFGTLSGGLSGARPSGNPENAKICPKLGAPRMDDKVETFEAGLG